MPLNDAILGAIKGQPLPFGLYETRTSDFSTHYDDLRGEVWELPGGLSAMLVRADGAQADAEQRCWEWTDIDEYDVQVTSATGDEPMGFTLPGMAAIADNDYFFVVVPAAGSGRVTLENDGTTTIAAGDYVQATDDGQILTDGTFDHANPGTSFGIALSADAVGTAGTEIDVLILTPLKGINA